MSAFIVEDKTINRIVNFLVHEVRNYSYSDDLEQRLSELGYDFTDDSFAEKLANDMFALNVSAIRQRYEEVGPVPTFAYVQSSPASLIQSLKSLRCWLYQCTEGDVPKSRIYKFFVEVVEKHFLQRIVYELPEYEGAEWA